MDETDAWSTAVAPVRVFVVDDHELVRRGLLEVLLGAGDIEIVGECATAAEAVRRIPAARPDVVLLDIRLPDGSGIEVCREVRSRDPRVRALMLTSYEDHEAAMASLLAGASGVALKQIRSRALVEAVRAVAAGRSLLTMTDRAGLVGRLTGPAEHGHLLATLSRQERRVLDGIVDGLTNRQIGDRLKIAEQTVKNHVSTLLAKLGVEHRTQAAVLGEQIRWHSRPSSPGGPPDSPPKAPPEVPPDQPR